jgi:hypothetical protein
MNLPPSTHLATWCCASTIAFALAMPEIPWLRPIALALIATTWVLSSGEDYIGSHLFHLGCVYFCVMGLVFLNTTAPHADIAHSIRLTQSHALIMIGLWSVWIHRHFKQFNTLQQNLAPATL